MERSGFAERMNPGARVAVGVGSRGIANIAEITAGVIRYWRDRGMRPFIFPAMGSHGAATAQGQADVLGHLGVTEAAMGCPIVSRLDVVSLGRTEDGIEAFMDAEAYGADAVMVVGRVKWHTNFAGRIESGLMKMMAIGLGKFAGAQQYHAHGQRLGLEHVIRTVGRKVLATGKMIGGLAIMEDAHHQTAKLDAVPASEMEPREEQNLALAKSWMPKLPCDLDLLVVDEIGKNISGTGMDAKVVNRGVRSEQNAWPGIPTVDRIFVRELSAETHGNAVGIGMADIVTDRLVAQIDWAPTMINAQTSGNPARIRLPVHLATDRECLDWLLPTVGRTPAEIRIGWIHNTLELSRVAVTENLRDDLARGAEIERDVEVRWDAQENLVSVFGGRT